MKAGRELERGFVRMGAIHVWLKMPDRLRRPDAYIARINLSGPLSQPAAKK